MLRTRGRHRRRIGVAAEINITNLVDVAFVLLIIFMITAPILQGGIEVQLPQAEATPLTTPDAVVVSVASNGDVFVEKTRVASLEEFETVLSGMVDTGNERRPVQVKGDRGVEYGRVMEVMGRLNGLGIQDVGLVVEPRPR